MSSRTCVCEAIDSVTEALTSCFVPKYLGFRHMSCKEIMRHVPSFTKTVLGTGPNELIAVLDGTHIFIDRFSDFALQQKTFSTHKHINLLKTMMVSWVLLFCRMIVSSKLFGNNGAHV